MEKGQLNKEEQKADVNPHEQNCEQKYTMMGLLLLFFGTLLKLYEVYRLFVARYTFTILIYRCLSKKRFQQYILFP